MSYILLALSLLLGLLGTFTETFHKADNAGGGRKITIWGKAVGVLLVISAALSAYNIYIERSAAQKAAMEAQRSLSQQRLIAIAAASTSYQLKDQPYVGISYTVAADPNDTTEYGREYSYYESFPGFGANLRGFAIHLSLTDNRSFLCQSGTPGSTPDDFTTFSGDTITYAIDTLPNEVNHLCLLDGYRALDEFLFEFRSGRAIGFLKLWKANGTFSEDDLSTITNSLADERGYFHSRAYMKRDSIDLYLAHIDVPINIGRTFRQGSFAAVELLAGEPTMDSQQFVPF